MSDVFSTDPPAIDASRRFTPDLAAWSREQARLLRARSAQEIDWEGAATALDVIGDGLKQEIGCHLSALLALLLRWEILPDGRSLSWQSRIGIHRTFLRDCLEASPSLHGFAREILPGRYCNVARAGAYDPALAGQSLPPACPYKLQQILADDFMPGAPWLPEDLIRD